MHLTFHITTLLIIFSILLAFAWMWFFSNEKKFSAKLYNEGLKALEKGQLKKAEKLFKRAIATNPDIEEAKYQLGLVYMKQNAHDKAAETFGTVLEKNPKDVSSMIAMGKTLQSQESFEKAAEYFNAVLETNSNDFDSLMGLGLIKYKKGQYQEAKELLERAGSIAPNDINAQFYINKCNDNLCKYENDENCSDIIERYLELGNSQKELPDDYYISLAQAYAKTGKLEDAEKNCHLALKASPEDAESYKLLGIINLTKKDFATAKNLLMTALKLQPNDEEIQNILSYVVCYQVDNCPLDRCRERYKELLSKMIK